MAWLIGVDEAGYGPNLGPLVIGVSAWKIDQPVGSAEVDLYQTLASAVSPTPVAGRIAIADSKQLYKPGGGLALLEEAVHAARGGATSGESFRTLVESLKADPTNALAKLPWHQDFDVSLPINAPGERVAESTRLLGQACAGAGVSEPMLRARLVFPAEFNQLVQRYETKGAALSHVTLGLLREVYDVTRGAATCILDKHGGRNRYGALLQHHFPEHWLETHKESRAESHYTWGTGDEQVSFAFRSGGERFLSTALASMTAKYLRELSMKAFNQYWAHQVPGIRPTAGYPVDARRFQADIAEKQQELGIENHMIWRER